MTFRVDQTGVVGRVCRDCGKRFATNDLSSATCDPCLQMMFGVGVAGGQGRTVSDLRKDRRVLVHVLVVLAWAAAILVVAQATGLLR